MIWKITVLYYGHISTRKARMTPGLDEDLVFDSPYLGFLLQKNGENVLVDCGIHERFIVDGKAWGGQEAVGGRSYVIQALKDAGLEPKDISMVIYTHLHNDHAGACEYFLHAKNVFQKKEWENLLNPLPSQQTRGDYDLEVIDTFRTIENIYMIDGDVELANGLKLYLTPGHTKGSMCVLVPTGDGPRVIVGDTFSRSYSLFPKSTELMLMNGEVVPITPLPDNHGPVLIHNLIYDQYAYYESYYKIKALVPEFESKYFLLGHEPGLLITGA